MWIHEDGRQVVVAVEQVRQWNSDCVTIDGRTVSGYRTGTKSAPSKVKHDLAMISNTPVAVPGGGGGRLSPDVAFRLDFNRSPCGHYPLEKRVLIGCGPDIVLSHSTRHRDAERQPLGLRPHQRRAGVPNFGLDADKEAYRVFNDLLRTPRTPATRLREG